MPALLPSPLRRIPLSPRLQALLRWLVPVVLAVLVLWQLLRQL